jgi:hypothetical protein
MTELVGAPVPVAWSVKYTPEGRRFYYNKATKERTWRKPPELAMAEKERAPQRAAAAKATQPSKVLDDGPVIPRSPVREGGGDADSGRGVAPDVGDSPDTGASWAREGAFVMDEDGCWVRVDSLENEYLTVEGGAFAPYKHAFVIRDTPVAPSAADASQLRAAVAGLKPPPAAGAGRRRRASSASEAPPPPMPPAAPPAPPAAPSVPIVDATAVDAQGAAGRGGERSSERSSSAAAARARAGSTRCQPNRSPGRRAEPPADAKGRAQASPEQQPEEEEDWL